MVFILTSLFASNAIAQKQIVLEGITLPRTITFEDKTLQLNGAGSRSKMWTDVYIQALYLNPLSQNAKEIINDNFEMSMRIEIISSLVSSGKFSKALHTGFEKSAGADFDKYKAQMESLKKILSDDIKKGDVFELTYSPKDSSMHIIKNRENIGKIAGLDFKKIFFGIWLGDKPVDEILKNNLLGIY